MTEELKVKVEDGTIRCSCKTSDETGTASGYTCQWHRERLLAALKLRETRVLTAAISRVAEEPELPGPMPDDIWASLSLSRESAEEVLRAIVRATKVAIVADFQKRMEGTR